MPSPSPCMSFSGYAVVSAEGYIADIHGDMPQSLRFEADWDYFQTALDQADITLLGRRTHEAAPNVRHRCRLVISRRVQAIVQEDEQTWWANPDQVEAVAVLSKLAGPTCRIAVVGGTGVFDWVRTGPGFSEFHISLAKKVRLGRGRPIFESAHDLGSVVSMLEDQGLTLHQRSWFDQEAGLELLVYRL